MKIIREMIRRGDESCMMHRKGVIQRDITDSSVIPDLFSQSALQLIEVDDGIAGVQQVQLAVEGAL